MGLGACGAIMVRAQRPVVPGRNLDIGRARTQHREMVVLLALASVPRVPCVRCNLVLAQDPSVRVRATSSHCLLLGKDC